MESDEKLYQLFCIEYDKVNQIIEDKQKKISELYQTKADIAKSKIKRVKNGLAKNTESGIDPTIGIDAIIGIGSFLKNKVISEVKKSSVILTQPEISVMWQSFINMQKNNSYSIHIPAAIIMLKKIQYSLPDDYLDIIKKF